VTGRDLVSASLRLIGAIAPGESLAAGEATDGLAALNRMLDSWSTEGLMIHAITEESPITLTAGDATYTLGTGGDNTSRPMSIEKAVIRNDSVSPALDTPVNLLSLSEWTSISAKGVRADYPHSLYDDGGFPLRTVSLYPAPASAKKLVLWTKRALTQIASLDATVSLPPGYERAIVYNGAMELAPEYGRAVPEVVVLVASQSKSNLKRLNERKTVLTVDAALIPGGRFNIYTGDSR
jgi:hypothetical protein